MYLAYTAIAEAAVSRNLPGEATDALLKASELVANWRAEVASAISEIPPSADRRSVAVQRALMKSEFNGWMSFVGCVGSAAEFKDLAGHIDSIALTALQLPATSEADAERLRDLRASLPEIGASPWAGMIERYR